VSNPAEVAVVTGGASGFGLALAESCVAAGMTTGLLDLDGDRAMAEADRLTRGRDSDHGGEAFGLGVDVGSEGSVAAAAATVMDRHGRADLVISNVGVQLFGSIEGMTDDEWRWVLDVNVAGSARVARHFLPLLRRSSNGRVAFTASSSVLDPASRLGAYQASKFAVWGLAETLRLEVAADGILVSVIFPSGMMSRHLETSEAAQPPNLRRPIATEEDFDVMRESNPALAATVATPQVAAAGVLGAMLAGERYVITHGDVVAAVDARCADLRRAAEAARSRF
jgi:NAD(P)-dependent dehydrogenase (short-subunit alcohol dehydrogenase family)